MARLANVHPGEILLEEFLQPMGLSQNKVANDIGVPPRRINEIVHGKRAISADTAVRLARYFGTTEAFWLGLQADYDIEEVRKDLGKRLDRIPRHAAQVSVSISKARHYRLSTRRRRTHWVFGSSS